MSKSAQGRQNMFKCYQSEQQMPKPQHNLVVVSWYFCYNKGQTTCASYSKFWTNLAFFLELGHIDCLTTLILNHVSFAKIMCKKVIPQKRVIPPTFLGVSRLGGMRPNPFVLNRFLVGHICNVHCWWLFGHQLCIESLVLQGFDIVWCCSCMVVDTKIVGFKGLSSVDLAFFSVLICWFEEFELWGVWLWCAWLSVVFWCVSLCT